MLANGSGDATRLMKGVVKPTNRSTFPGIEQTRIWAWGQRNRLGMLCAPINIAHDYHEESNRTTTLRDPPTFSYPINPPNWDLSTFPCSIDLPYWDPSTFSYPVYWTFAGPSTFADQVEVTMLEHFATDPSTFSYPANSWFRLYSRRNRKSNLAKQQLAPFRMLTLQPSFDILILLGFLLWFLLGEYKLDLLRCRTPETWGLLSVLSATDETVAEHLDVS